MAPPARMLTFCTNWGVKAKRGAEGLRIAGLAPGSLVSIFAIVLVPRAPARGPSFILLSITVKPSQFKRIANRRPGTAFVVIIFARDECPKASEVCLTDAIGEQHLTECGAV